MTKTKMQRVIESWYTGNRIALNRKDQHDALEVLAKIAARIAQDMAEQDSGNNLSGQAK